MKIQVKPSIKKINGRTFKRWVVRAIGNNGKVINTSEILNSKSAVLKNIKAASKVFAGSISKDGAKTMNIEFPKVW